MGSDYLAVMFVIISLTIRLWNGPKIHQGAQRDISQPFQRAKTKISREICYIYQTVDRAGGKCVVSNMSTKLQASRGITHTKMCWSCFSYQQLCTCAPGVEPRELFTKGWQAILHGKVRQFQIRSPTLQQSPATKNYQITIMFSP